MPPPAEHPPRDDASGEAWFQKGVTLLEDRKEEREIEEKLRKEMDQSVWQQWQMLPAVLIWTAGLWQAQISTASASPVLIGSYVFMGGIFLLNAIDSAANRRTKTMLEWMKYQHEREAGKNGGNARHD